MLFSSLRPDISLAQAGVLDKGAFFSFHVDVQLERYDPLYGVYPTENDEDDEEYDEEEDEDEEEDGDEEYLDDDDFEFEFLNMDDKKKR